jgi:hypothetical protein
MANAALQKQRDESDYHPDSAGAPTNRANASNHVALQTSGT